MPRLFGAGLDKAQSMRLDNWNTLLNKHFQSIGPFKWGENDCCMFSVECVKVITGVDHGTEYRGYRSASGAYKVLKTYDGVEGIATRQLGQPKPITQANRGDVVSFKNGEQIALGICLGDKIAAIGEYGLIFMPISVGIKSWSV